MDQSSSLKKETTIKISEWIRDYVQQTNMNCLVVGISGGIDSALVSTLCGMTGIKTYVLSMPIHQAPSHLERAEKHIDWLKQNFENVESLEVDLTETFEGFKKLFPAAFLSELSLANTRSRLRMITLYQVAGSKKGLVVGTGNKVEDFGVGFYTKYGDGGVDISPIGNFTKTEVRQLAAEQGIIREILQAKPSDGLWGDDRSDEDQLGASYEELEWAMCHIATRVEKDEPDLDGLSPREKEVLCIYSGHHEKNKHKMVPIPVFHQNPNG